MAAKARDITDDDSFIEQIMEDYINSTQADIMISSPEYSGWLLKKKNGWITRNFIFLRNLQWKRKWTILHGVELKFMSDKPVDRTDLSDIIIKTSILTSNSFIDKDQNNHNERKFRINNNLEIPTCTLEAESLEDKQSWIKKITQVIAINKWMDEYEKIKVLGVGGQGVVYELENKKTKKRYAMKEMTIKNEKQMQNALTEATLLKDLMETVAHPNIMEIDKVFQVGSMFYIVFPLCTGGELYSHIVERGHFTERDASVLVHDLISALDALHKHNILHLDIKPENILFESNDMNSIIKLTDFGLSKLFSDVLEKQMNNELPSAAILEEKTRLFVENKKLEQVNVRGTIGYMSPELILTGYYSTGTDVFASGVVFYILLCGRPPFYVSKSKKQTFLKTVKGEYNTEGHIWSYITDEAKDLLHRMLEVNPAKRITTAEILRHPFITQVQDDINISKSTLNMTSCQTTKKVMDDLNISINSGSAHEQESNNYSDQIEIRNKQQDEHHHHDDTLSTNDLRAVSVSEKVGGFAEDDNNEDEDGTFKQNYTGKGYNPVKVMQTVKETGIEKVSSTREENTENTIHNSIKGAVAPISQLLRKTNLIDGLNMLGDHVKKMRAERFIGRDPLDEEQKAELTKMKSFAGFTGYNHDSKLATIFLHPDDPINSFPQNPWENEILRYGFATAMNNVGDSRGRVTLEQFDGILKYFGFEHGEMYKKSFSPGTGLGGLALLRLFDRDDDGLITADDVFTAQVLGKNKHLLFLETIFRIYQESLWYFGRVVNYKLAHSHASSHPNNSSSQVLENESNRKNEEINKNSPIDNNKPVPLQTRKRGESIILSDVFVPPKYITAKHVGSVFEAYGYDVESGHKVFRILLQLLNRLSLTKSKSKHSTFTNSEKIKTNPINKKKSNFNLMEYIGFSKSKEGRMDFEDFVKVCKIDSILIHVLFQTSNKNLQVIIDKAEQLAALQEQDININDEFEEISHKHSPAAEIACKLFEDELKAAVVMKESELAAASKQNSILPPSLTSILGTRGSVRET